MLDELGRKRLDVSNTRFGGGEVRLFDDQGGVGAGLDARDGVVGPHAQPGPPEGHRHLGKEGDPADPAR